MIEQTILKAQQQYLQEILSQQHTLPQVIQKAYDCADLTDNRDGEMILGLGEGSSFFALQLAQPWLGAWLGKPVVICKPLNWLTDWNLYHSFGLGPEITDLLMVSQSGETGSLQHIMNNNPPGFDIKRSWLFTNNAESTLAEKVNNVCLLYCQAERSIPATVTMSASWFALLYWGVKHLPVPLYNGAAAMLKDAAQLEWLTSSLVDAVQQQVKQTMQQRPVVLLGQYHTVTPLPEVALKLMETSGQLAVADRIENFSHGPKATLSSLPNVWVWVATQDGVVRTEALKRAFPELPLALIGLGVGSNIVPTVQLPQPVNDINCQLMTLITGQLLSWAWCVHRHASPNHPLLTKHVSQI